MDRVYRRIPLGDGGTRHRVVLTDVASAPGWHADQRRYHWLRELAEAYETGILACGPMQFETMRVAHSGTAWEAHLEAVEAPR